MKKSMNLLLTLVSAATVFFGITTTVFAQQTSRGRDFYVSFMPNFHSAPVGDSLTIFVVAEQPTNGTISYRTPSNNDTIISFSITNPASIYQFSRPWRNHELWGVNNSGTFSFTNNDNEKPVRKAFRVQTDQDVAVYALNIAFLTTDATLVLPTPALGKEYFVLSYNADGIIDNRVLPPTRDGQYTPSQVCIIATQDNTIVNIVPSTQTTETGLSTKSITLNAGEVFFMQSDLSTTSLRNDLSGTSITSSYPVAVFSGHQRATIPVTLRSGSASSPSRDHLFEQLIPTNVWGKSFVITPFRESRTGTPPGNDIYRVVASDDNTVLRFRGVPLATIGRGQVFESPLTQAGMLTASRKVSVALYRRTSGTSVRAVGDPFMMIIPPRSQYLTKYRFQNCNTGSAFTEQFITIITTRPNIPTVRLDGLPVTAPFTDIPGTCYVFANITTTDGAHTLTSDRFIGLYVYGYGEANSYGYVGGMAFNPDIEDVFVTGGDDKNICIGDSVVLTASGNYVSLKWSELRSNRKIEPCDTCPTITLRPRISTDYLLFAIDSLGCEVRDTVRVFVNEIPTVNATPDTVVCSDSPIILRATGSYQSAEWSPSIGLSCTFCDNTVLIPTQDMMYVVTARNGNSERCAVRDTIRVKFAPGVHSQLKPKYSICEGDSITFTLQYGGKLRWTPTNLFTCDTCKQVTIKPKTNVKITVTGDSAGCSTMATTEVSIANKASVVLLPDTTICKGQTLRLTVKTTSNDILWSPSDFLDCVTCPTVNLTPDVSMRYFVRIGNPQSSCIVIDTINVSVVDRPALQVSPRDTSICIGSSITINATSNGTSLRWSPKAGLNCDTCASPQFTPTTSGIYTFYVTAFSDTLCTVIDSVRVRVADYPTLKLSSTDTSICRGVQVTLSAITSGNIRWRLSPGISCDTCSSNTFTPDSTRTYYVVVRNAEGCEVSDSIIIRVNDIPFGILNKRASDICLGRSDTFSLSGLKSVGTIRWQPSTYLDCDTCLRVISTPRTNTTYVVTITSPDNCVFTDTVRVSVVPCNKIITVIRNINLGDVLACDTVNTFLDVNTNGSNTAITIRSITVVPGSSVVVSGLEKIILPDSLQPNEVRRYPLVITPPSAFGDFSVQIVVRSNGTDSIQTLTIVGKSVQYPVTAEAMSVGGTVGEKITLPIRMSSAHWTALGITKVQLRIRAIRSQLEPLKTVSLPERLKPTWTATFQKSDVSGDTIISTYLLEGTTPLANDSIVMYADYMTLITNVFSYPVSLELSFPSRQVDCIDERTISATIPVIGCAKEIRSIAIGATEFALKTIAPNPISGTDINVRFGVGYDTALKIDVIDDLGRVNATLFEGKSAAGDYELIADVSSLSSGLYYIRYSVADMVFVQRIGILR